MAFHDQHTYFLLERLLPYGPARRSAGHGSNSLIALAARTEQIPGVIIAEIAGWAASHTWHILELRCFASPWNSVA